MLTHQDRVRWMRTGSAAVSMSSSGGLCDRAPLAVGTTQDARAANEWSGDAAMVMIGERA